MTKKEVTLFTVRDAVRHAFDWTDIRCVWPCIGYMDVGERQSDNRVVSLAWGWDSGVAFLHHNLRTLHTLKMNCSKIFVSMVSVLFGEIVDSDSRVVKLSSPEMFSKSAHCVFKNPLKYLCSMKLLCSVKSTPFSSRRCGTESMFDHMTAVLWSDWTLHGIPQTRRHAARPQPSVVLRESGNDSLERKKKYRHPHVKMQDHVSGGLRVQISGLPEQHLE